MAQKILIAESDTNLAVMLEACLGMNGYEVLTVNEGRSALQNLSKEKPSLLVLDVLIPEVSSFEIIQQLRQMSPPLNRIPVIVLLSKKKMAEIFNPSDIFAFVNKPVVPKRLLAAVREGIESLRIPEVKKKAPAVAATRPRNERYVVLTAQQDFIKSRVINFLKEQGYKVEVGWDEEDAVQRAAETQAEAVLCQYWEDPTQFNAGKVYKKLKSNPVTRDIPFFSFCLESLAIDASQMLPRNSLIPYHESTDLLESLEQAMDELVR